MRQGAVAATGGQTHRCGVFRLRFPGCTVLQRCRNLTSICHRQASSMSTTFYPTIMLPVLNRNPIHSHIIMSTSLHHKRDYKIHYKRVLAISHAVPSHDRNNKPRPASSVVSSEAPSHKLLHTLRLQNESLLQKAHDYDSYLTKLPV